MFFGVFRFAKKLKVIRAGFIVNQVSPGHFYCMRWSSLVEMMGDDNSAADAVS